MKLVWVIYAILLVLVICLALACSKQASRMSKSISIKEIADAGTCSISSCGIDPVSDPKYNMKQIAKQSILLEEHITHKQKRCKDCIIKHFLHIIGLSEEAVWLACDRVDTFPLLKDSVEFYNNVFDKWTKGQADDENLHNVASELRDMRKAIISKYF